MPQNKRPRDLADLVARTARDAHGLAVRQKLANSDQLRGQRCDQDVGGQACVPFSIDPNEITGLAIGSNKHFLSSYRGCAEAKKMQYSSEK
jgi:hypothetical protein